MRCPVLVNTVMTPRFLFESELRTADMNSPLPPPMAPHRMPCWRASCGWYTVGCDDAIFVARGSFVSGLGGGTTLGAIEGITFRQREASGRGALNRRKSDWMVPCLRWSVRWLSFADGHMTGHVMFKLLLFAPLQFELSFSDGIFREPFAS